MPFNSPFTLRSPPPSNTPPGPTKVRGIYTATTSSENRGRKRYKYAPTPSSTPITHSDATRFEPEERSFSELLWEVLRETLKPKYYAQTLYVLIGVLGTVIVLFLHEICEAWLWRAGAVFLDLLGTSYLLWLLAGLMVAFGIRFAVWYDEVKEIGEYERIIGKERTGKGEGGVGEMEGEKRAGRASEEINEDDVETDEEIDEEAYRDIGIKFSP